MTSYHTVRVVECENSRYYVAGKDERTPSDYVVPLTKALWLSPPEGFLFAPISPLCR